VDWIAGLLGHMQARGLTCVEATEAAQADWVRHGMEVAEKTLYPSAASWYMGANIPGKPRVFMPYIGGVGVYRETCDEIAGLHMPGKMESLNVSVATGIALFETLRQRA